MRGDALGPVAFITLCVKSGLKRCVSGMTADLPVETVLACLLVCSLSSTSVFTWNFFSSETMVRASCFLEILKFVYDTKEKLAEELSKWETAKEKTFETLHIYRK